MYTGDASNKSILKSRDDRSALIHCAFIVGSIFFHGGFM